MTEAADQLVAVHCVAEGVGSEWEAFCLDFDLAVQGSDFEEVHAKLNDQIALYVETLSTLPDLERQRLLRRHAPLSVTLPLMFRVIKSTLFRRGTSPRYDYVMPLALHAPA